MHWPNGWKGGFIDGRDAVADYWQRQWKEINPHVEPVSFNDRSDGRMEVKVHQVVRDLQNNLLLDKMIKHIYTIETNLVKSMEIEEL